MLNLEGAQSQFSANQITEVDILSWDHRFDSKTAGVELKKAQQNASKGFGG